MAEQPTVEELLKRNQEYASSKHEPQPIGSDLQAMGLPFPRQDRLLVIACADPRAVPEGFLQIQSKDGVLVMRNVGGRVKSFLPGIYALDTFLNFQGILVVHHTDCGATHMKEDVVRNILSDRVPEKAAEIKALQFGAYTSYEDSVREDLNILKADPLIRKELARNLVGFVYDIKTGLLTPVQHE